MEKPRISYWERTVWFDQCDVLVVGGGVVGLHAAIALKEREPTMQVTLVERHPIALGASTRNAGFACFGSMSELVADMEQHGSEHVFRLIKMRLEGLRKLRNRLGDEAIDYRHDGAYEIFLAGEHETYSRCLEAMDKVNEYLEKLTGNRDVFRLANNQIGPMGLHGVENMIHCSEEGQLHPGKMVERLQSVARTMGVRLLTGFEVDHLSESDSDITCHLSSGAFLKAKQCILAVNGFAREFIPDLPLRGARNQVLLCKPDKPKRLTGNFHYKQGYVYFRSVENYLLIGGGRHVASNEESTVAFGQSTKIRQYLHTMMTKHIIPGQKYEVIDAWSGILGIGDEKKPIVRRENERTVLAVRLGGMGVAIGALVGEQAADLILDKTDTSV